MDIMIRQNINILKANLFNWISKHKNQHNGLFYYSDYSKKPTILSVSFGVLALELLREIRNLSEYQKKNIVSFLEKCLNTETDLYIDPAFKEKDLLLSQIHCKDYIIFQSTYFALNALDTLGVQPDFRLKFMDRFKEWNYLKKWLEARNWRNPWLESNNIMFIWSFIIYEYLQTEEPNLYDLILKIFDWLDMHHDPDTGFWGTDKGATLLSGMAGAYHFIPFYFYFKRPINYFDKIVDNTLAFQQKDGMFNPKGGGSACEDLDAIDILCKFYKTVDYRREDIYSSLYKACIALIFSQNKDGGFSDRILPDRYKIKRIYESGDELPRLLFENNMKQYKNNKKKYKSTSYYSNWKRMKVKVYESDMWSAWFRPLAIFEILDIIKPEMKLDFKPVFRRLPCLGWHF